jgi:pimeloyl-ACP methyl ester carboxylesterase
MLMTNWVRNGSTKSRRSIAARHRTLLIALEFVLVAMVAMVAVATLRSAGPTMKSIGENRMTTSRDGTAIAFTKMGAGPAVILVDGAFCYRENGPAPELAPLLAPHFTVFTYDRRGRGESSDTSPYAIDREVEDLRAIVENAGGSAFVVGVSSGAALALQAAASGVHLTELALYEPPYIPGDGTPRSGEDPRKRLQQLVSSGDRHGAVKFFMTDVFGAPRAFVFAMPFIMRSAWKRNESVAHTLPYDLTILNDRSVLRERSGSISVPTLVIGGEKSPEPLRNAVSTVAQALPNAHSRLLPGQSHNLAAAVLAPVLVEFFLQSDRHAATGSAVGLPEPLRIGWKVCLSGVRYRHLLSQSPGAHR